MEPQTAPSNPYQLIEDRIASAQASIAAGKLGAAESAVVDGWCEIGRQYRDAQAAGTDLTQADRALSAYNAQLLRLEGQILAQGSGKAYRRGKELALTGLEKTLGAERYARLTQDARDYQDAVSAGTRAVVTEVKDAYAEAKAGVAKGSGWLSRKLKSIADKLEGE